MKNIELLKSLYKTYSPSGKEWRMVKFLRSYAKSLPGKIKVKQDKYGNLYMTKGKAETYPCAVAHMDQVSHCHHSKDFTVIETEELLFGYSPKNRRFENLGADDKNGVWIALTCLEKYDNIKVAFFREEETGCVGSTNADMDFFKDCRFIIQPDRRGNGDLITNIGFTDICSEKFVEDIKPELYGYAPTTGAMTDVEQLTEQGVGISCINLSCGYYNPHSDEEITVKADLFKCLKFVEHIIETCTASYPHDSMQQGMDWYVEDEIYDVISNNPELSVEDLYQMYHPFYPFITRDELQTLVDECKMMQEDDDNLFNQFYYGKKEENNDTTATGASLW